QTIAHTMRRKPVALRDCDPIYVRFGSKADIAASRSLVRFAPESGHRELASACPLSATTGPMHRRIFSGLVPVKWLHGYALRSIASLCDRLLRARCLVGF